MQTGFYQNTGGMVTQFNRLDMVSNNLANLNTNGFKRDDLIIGDFMRLYKEERDILPIENNTKDGSKFLNRSMVRVPIVVEEFTDQSGGAILSTNNPLDVAFQQKNMFFAIETPAGKRYTRDGSFSLNQIGEVVNKEGHKLLSITDQPIRLNPSQSVTISTDGRIYTKNEGTLNEPGLVGQIKIVTFENPKYLQKMGNNLFVTDKEEVAMTGDNLVKQGFIEKSNVNAVSEMTSLIEVNRLVGMYQKVMDTQMNELNQDAINKLGIVKV
ncbi:MAG: flagellar hook-basal body protein [Campylobacterales bacterium]|nr:flagellar hook-basal body protein [Campylobacterales bacterium]